MDENTNRFNRDNLSDFTYTRHTGCLKDIQSNPCTMSIQPSTGQHCDRQHQDTPIQIFVNCNNKMHIALSSRHDSECTHRAALAESRWFRKIFHNHPVTAESIVFDQYLFLPCVGDKLQLQVVTVYDGRRWLKRLQKPLQLVDTNNLHIPTICTYKQSRV